jgi:hypothetical protein
MGVMGNQKHMISKKIRNSAKDQTCTLRVSPKCDYNQTVVSCHISSPFRGMALKSPDIFIAHGCYFCHYLLDSGKVSAADQLRAMQETQMRLVEQGLIEVA